MPGDFVTRLPQFTLEVFHAFRDERPKEEKWELIDGVPVMMPPPTLVHQRIARNLEMLLNERLAKVKPEWQADREIGILLPQDEKFNPEPDVTVVDSSIGIGQIYAERFYFVAEVLSGSDKVAVLEAKLGYYQAHAPCVGILLVRQDEVRAELYRRLEGWSSIQLAAPQSSHEIPWIGNIGSLGSLYRHTPLWQPEWAIAAS